MTERTCIWPFESRTHVWKPSEKDSELSALCHTSERVLVRWVEWPMSG